MKWKLSRNQLFAGSGFILIALYLLQYLTSIEIISCGDDPHLTCYFFFQHLSAFGFGLIPLFILSATSYFMRENVFDAWLKLVYVYLLLLILAVSVLSSSNGGYIFSSDLSIVLILVVPSFVIISIVLIIWKYFSLRRSQ